MKRFAFVGILFVISVLVLCGCSKTAEQPASEIFPKLDSAKVTAFTTDKDVYNYNELVTLKFVDTMPKVVNFVIDWGDGYLSESTPFKKCVHNYQISGNKTIKVSVGWGGVINKNFVTAKKNINVLPGALTSYQIKNNRKDGIIIRLTPGSYQEVKPGEMSQIFYSPQYDDQPENTPVNTILITYAGKNPECSGCYLSQLKGTIYARKYTLVGMN
ncbi:hypothetical protein [Mucilaginibacter sp. PAMB04168]|uniref:hypothetical protein n=1 Tax=Mucilaginibacter sp. PAMB04168 TaxID=3138567 RepID=UPI0031F6B4A6